jgi:hypothetical protein
MKVQPEAGCGYAAISFMKAATSAAHSLEAALPRFHEITGVGVLVPRQ